MNEIINIPITDGKVNARDLHKELKVGRDFSTWIRGRIEEYGFEKSIDFVENIGFPQNGGKPGRPLIEYKITLGMAKELAMLEKNQIGRRVRKYFIKCEENLIEAVKKNMVPKEMYLEAVSELKELEQSNELLTKNYNDVRLMYQNCTNEVAEYVISNLAYKKSGKIKCMYLYNHYCRWCHNTPHYEPYDKKQFEELLLERMVDGHSIKKDGNYYLGIQTIK